MRILITNDDGLYSPGIWELVRALRPLGEITVVAPRSNMSGSSAATLYYQAFRFEEASPPGEDLDGIRTRWRALPPAASF